MAERLAAGGHRVIGYDRAAAARQSTALCGADQAESVEALVAALGPPRAVWLMVPAGVVDVVLDELTPMLSPGDAVIDGVNSNYRETVRRSAALRKRGLHYIDVETSGGIWGLKEGYCLMVGCEG